MLVFLSLNVGESVSETTPFIEGPSDTSEIDTGSLFRSKLLWENIVESTGPVLSFTLQVPQAAIRSGDSVAQPGIYMYFKALCNLSILKFGLMFFLYFISFY